MTAHRWSCLGMLVLGGLVFLASLPIAPSITNQGRDSGIYAYTAWAVADGAVLYRDVWGDNKPPVMFYADALAFKVFGANRWALWLLGIGTVWGAALVLYWLLCAVYPNRLIALAGTLIFVLLARNPALVEEGNYPETYALLFQVIGLAAGYRGLTRPGARWAYSFGLAAGLMFLTKQTAVGVVLALPPALVLSRSPVLHAPRRWLWLGSLLLGGVTSIGGMALYLLACHALRPALESIVFYSVQFRDWVNNSPPSFLETFRNTFAAHSFLVVVLVPLLPVFALGITAAVYHARHTRDQRATLEIWVVLSGGIDLVLANLTGWSYDHYYIVLIPFTVLVSMAGLAWLAEIRGRRRTIRRVRFALWNYLLLVIGVSFVWMAVLGISASGSDLFGPAREHPLVAYVESHTAPGDTVLVWGVSPEINFQSHRRSPTRYHYGYPLVVPGSIARKHVEQMVEDLERNRPVLIVDTARGDGIRIPPLGPEQRAAWWAEGGRRDVQDLGPIYQFVAAHCAITDTFDQAVIYRCQY